MSADDGVPYALTRATLRAVSAKRDLLRNPSPETLDSFGDTVRHLFGLVRGLKEAGDLSHHWIPVGHVVEALAHLVVASVDAEGLAVRCHMAPAANALVQLLPDLALEAHARDLGVEEDAAAILDEVRRVQPR